MANKFKALVHYICWKCPDPTKLGAVKLNKILWLADSQAFRTHGKSITGERYVKRAMGPVPKPILPILRELEEVGDISIRMVPRYAHTQRQFIAKTEPDTSMFEPGELDVVDDTIDMVCNGHTARSVSELTHDDIWRLAEDGEEMPLYATLVSRLDPVTDADVRDALVRMGSSE